MFGGRGKRWTETDVLLMMGLTLYEDGRNIHSCGHDLAFSASPEMADNFEIDDSLVCFACEALEAYRESGKNHQPGAVLRAVDGRPLKDRQEPTRRE